MQERIGSWISVFLIGVVGVLSGACTPKPTGFLSDYSNLRREGRNMKYRNPNTLADYKAFIIDPVEMHFLTGSPPFGMDRAEMRRLTDHLRYAVKAAIADAYPVVREPGPGVARVRLAITGLAKDRALGGASMEGEVVDSLTGEQIAAAILAHESTFLTQSQPLTDWARAQAVMDIWAKRMRATLDEIHGE